MLLRTALTFAFLSFAAATHAHEVVLSDVGDGLVLVAEHTPRGEFRLILTTEPEREPCRGRRQASSQVDDIRSKDERVRDHVPETP